MLSALKQAEVAEENGDVPIGAVIVHNNQIVAKAYNQREQLKDPTAHAEIIALTQAAAALETWRLNGCTIYVTLEPCPMCAGALVLARIDRLVYGCDDPKTGAVSGRPLSISPRETMFGYWSHLLTEAGAHAERLKRDAAGQFFVCSGYLYAIRARLVEHIPEDALAEDAVVSHLIGQQGHRIRYAPGAEVFVKYPSTYRDWLRQKVRSAGGYAQPIIARSPLRMRSFWHEAINGAWRALCYARNLREFAWTLVLMAARVHLWLLILWRVRVLRQPLTTLWKRVESTK